MKWIALTPLIILLTACGCCTNTSALEYRRVTYAPVVTRTYPTVVSRTVLARPVVSSPVVVTTPVYYDPLTVIDQDPIDVTTTTIDYY